MTESFRISTTITATPRQIYKAWLSSKEHTAFTGDKAVIDPKVGGHFTAFGDYIEGTNVELKPNERIVQAWRTTEFPANAEDSRLEVILAETTGGTRFTLKHSKIPKGQGDSYKDGWKKFYFEPMKEYFASK